MNQPTDYRECHDACLAVLRATPTVEEAAANLAAFGQRLAKLDKVLKENLGAFLKGE